MTAVGGLSRWARLNRSVRRVATALLVLTLCAVAAGPLAMRWLEELIRAEIQDRLARHYAGFEVRLRGARRVPGLGFELRGLTIRDSHSDPQLGQLVSIDEIFVHCSTALESLYKGDLRVRQVVLRRPQLRAERQRDGQLNLARLMPLPTFCDPPQVPPLIVIEEGLVRWSEAARPSNRPLVLHDVQLTLQPAAGEGGLPPGWQFRGTAAGENFQQAALQGTYQPHTCEWSLQGTVGDVKITPALVEHAPAELAEQLRPLAALRGRTELKFSARREPARLLYSIDGRFFDGWIKDELLPYSLTDLEADFHLGHDGLRVSGARARLGAAALQLELARSSLASASPLVLKASTRNFPLDQRLPRILPDHLRSVWDKYLPAGVAHASLVLTFDGRRYLPEITVDLPDVSFTYHRFPYRIHNAVGQLTIRDGVLRGHLRMPVSGKSAVLRCELRNLASGGTGWAEIETNGAIPLDEALLAAMPEKPQQLVRALNPAGHIEVFGRFERTDPRQEKFEKRLDVQLRNCSLRYDKFPYAIDKIQGTIIVEDDRWNFERLTGRHDSAFLTARGRWNPDAPNQRHLELAFDCTDVPLQEALRGALREDLRRLWTKLQPRGYLDHLHVDVGYNRVSRALDVELEGQKWPPQQNVEGRSLSLRPVWFPYRWDNITGTFHYARGTVTLRGVQAEHGGVRLKRLEASCDYDRSGQWAMRIPTLDVEDLVVDQELLAALPPKLAQPLGRVVLRGPVSLAGQMNFASPQALPGPVEADWALHLDVEDGQLQCGLPLEHIRGGLELRGSSGSQGLENRGELLIDSLEVRGLHLSQVRGPLRLDDAHLLLGVAADAAPSPSGAPRSVTALVFEGQLALDGRVSLGSERRFELYAALAEADLARIASEASGLAAQVTGRTFANLRLTGQAAARHTWRGDGSIRLFDADIYELPLMVALLKLPNVKTPDPTAFTNSDMRFRVEGDRLYFDRIALQGDAISLIGNGDMNAARQLNLNFYAVFGREELQLPWFRPLAKEAARNVLGIEVTGTLQQPFVTPRPFPELNETLQQLLRAEP